MCAQCVRVSSATQRTTAPAAASSCTKVRRHRIRCATSHYAHALSQAGAKLKSNPGTSVPPPVKVTFEAKRPPRAAMRPPNRLTGRVREKFSTAPKICCFCTVKAKRDKLEGRQLAIESFGPSLSSLIVYVSSPMV